MAPIEEYSYTFADGLMPMWHVTAFILGCCIGSFLNACIWRIPNNIPLASPPSQCPKCGYRIKWYENIPLFSWIALRARCSNCKQPISSRYFLIELLCGILFYLLWFKVLMFKQPMSLLILDYIVTAFIVTMAFIDLDHKIIPDKTTYPLMLIGLAMAPIFSELWGTASSGHAFLVSLASLVGTGVVMAVFAIAGKLIFKQDALGWGDVKYMMAIAACLGYRGAFFTLLIGSLAGSLAGVFLIAMKKGQMKTALPFGPFLAIGTFFWMLYAEKIPVWLLALSSALKQLV